MQSLQLVLCGLLAVSLAGCDGKDTITKDVPAPVQAPKTRMPEPAPDAGQSAGQKFELTPENTQIEFVGNHTSEDPKPRLGRFQQFAGEAVVDESLTSVRVEIETDSLATEFPKLDTHLKSDDFFGVETFPKAIFESTGIKNNGDGTVEITGDLTLLDKTSSLTFPATVSTENGLKLQAEFEIDRTLWGMEFGVNDVEKMVEMKITIEE